LIAERQQIVHRVCIIRYCQQIAVRNMTKFARHASRLVAETEQSRA